MTSFVSSSVCSSLSNACVLISFLSSALYPHSISLAVYLICRSQTKQSNLCKYFNSSKGHKLNHGPDVSQSSREKSSDLEWGLMLSASCIVTAHRARARNKTLRWASLLHNNNWWRRQMTLRWPPRSSDVPNPCYSASFSPWMRHTYETLIQEHSHFL